MAAEQLSRFPEHMFTPLCGYNRLMYFEIFHYFVSQFDSHIIRKLSFDDAVDAVADCMVREKLHYYTDENGEVVEKDVRKASTAIIRNLSRGDIGWLKKNDFDRDFNGRSVEVTKAGDYIYTKVILGAFDDLQTARWTCDINAIEDAIDNNENWGESPFDYGLMNVLEQTRNVANRLKQLNTIIDQVMIQFNRMRTMKGITGSFISFYDTFMPLYREMKEMLPPEKRHAIQKSLSNRFDDEKSRDALLHDYMKREGMKEGEEEQAARKLHELRMEIYNYFERDCPDTIDQIQAKITRYMMMFNHKLRFYQAHGANTQELIERFIIDGRDSREGRIRGKAPDPRKLIAFTCPFGYVDRRSLRPARKMYKIMPTEAVFDAHISDEEREKNREYLRKAMNNPFSTVKIRELTDCVMEGRDSIHTSELNIKNKQEALQAFLMVVEAHTNGYEAAPPSDKVIQGGFEMDDIEIRRRSEK